MKTFLLCLLLSLGITAPAQVEQLPQGRYEMIVKEKNIKWEKGDLLLLDDHRYKTTITNEIGEYRFSHTAQRIFFTSGPLKSLFARTVQTSGRPSIVFPFLENEQLGFQIAAADVYGYHRN